MKATPYLLLLLLTFATAAHAQTLALTFDDGLDPRAQPEAAAWNQGILDGLAAAKVRSMLLVACKNADSPAGMALVQAWARAGHAVGNHTYSHWDLSSTKVSAQDFIADAERCDKQLH